MPAKRKKRQKRAKPFSRPRRNKQADVAAAAEDVGQEEGTLAERVKADYSTPGHPVAYASPATVARFYNISQERAKSILNQVDTYTLHREYKKPAQFNPFYVHKRREQVQADLIEIGAIAKENDGVRYLLLLIDVMTKKVWVYPLTDKRGVSVSEALSKWISSLGRRNLPKLLLSDLGKEFIASSVQEKLRANKIKWQSGKGMSKAAVAERANKTIQVLIYKYLTDRETLRYIDVLPQLVATYNGRGHRTLKNMSPDEADKPENEGRVQEIFHDRYEKLAKKKANVKPRLKIDALVRVKTDSSRISSSRRAYAEQFHGEFYRIIRINRTMPVPMYHLRALDDGEFIDGGFYAEELQPVEGDLWKIESVLDERTRRGKKEIKVKWKYFGDRWNEWIPASNVQKVF
jgi:transposase InsO family protein